MHLVGRYALGVDWADDHGSIYPFDRLRRDCACGQCAHARAGHAAEMAWPEEIKRTAEGLRVTWVDRHTSLYRVSRICARCAAAPAAPAATDG